MPIDTQISSFSISAEIWNNGCTELPDLSALAIAVKDALAIERRFDKKVNLRNEHRRYTLLCDRVQGIVEELHYRGNRLNPDLVWTIDGTREVPRARAYLALMYVLVDWMRALSPADKKAIPYARAPSIFFPPEHAKAHLGLFDFLSRHARISSLFDLAAQKASIPGSGIRISSAECQQAFLVRHGLLRKIATQNCGLVDVLSIE